MTIDAPSPSQIPALKALWKTVFGDTEEYINMFFSTAFSCDRCLCVTVEEAPVCALYWFDLQYRGQKLAYLYAIATDPQHRKKGYFRKLMEYTHKHLRQIGYDGALLMPAEESLFAMYEKFGYTTCCYNNTFSCVQAGTPMPLVRLSANAYAAMRKPLLPPESVEHSSVMWDFLDRTMEFYKGEECLVACYREGRTAYVRELLGSVSCPEKIVFGLGCDFGHFRTPGSQTPFAMFHSLGNPSICTPNYLGFALD